jgi:hypothetical protein
VAPIGFFVMILASVAAAPHENRITLPENGRFRHAVVFAARQGVEQVMSIHHHPQRPNSIVPIAVVDFVDVPPRFRDCLCLFRPLNDRFDVMNGYACPYGCANNYCHCGPFQHCDANLNSGTFYGKCITEGGKFMLPRIDFVTLSHVVLRVCACLHPENRW